MNKKREMIRSIIGGMYLGLGFLSVTASSFLSMVSQNMEAYTLNDMFLFPHIYSLLILGVGTCIMGLFYMARKQ